MSELTKWEVFNITHTLLKVRDEEFIERVKADVKRGREFGGAAIREQLEKEISDRVMPFWESIGFAGRSDLWKSELETLITWLIFQIGGSTRDRQYIKRRLCPHLYPAV